MTDRAEELAREWAGDAPYHATKWTPIQATFGDVVELIHRVQEESAKPRDQADELAREAAAELRRARSLCGPMRGPHEGWAVIFEELDELWDEVKASKPKDPRRAEMRKEALQVAAMALGFIADVCDG